MAELPVLTKAELMEHFDDIVTDSRLSLAGLEAHLDTVETGTYLLGRYTALDLRRVSRPAGRVRLRLGRLGGVLADLFPHPAPGQEFPS